MFFDTHNEVIMSNYLNLAIIKNNSFEILSSNIFVDGFVENNNEHKLEYFYINLLKK
jgi:hypothetical protein